MDFTASTFEIKFTWPGKQLDIGKLADYKVGVEDKIGWASVITRFILITNCQVFYTTNSSLLLQLDNLDAGGQLFNLTTEQVDKIYNMFAKLDMHSVLFLCAFL